MRHHRKRFLLIVIWLLILAVGGGGIWLAVANGRRIQRAYTYTHQAFGNALLGYAPSAWHSTVGDDVTLLYMDITWRELEPEEGVYDWEKIEEENQLVRWRAEGKHIVLRFICDLPSDEAHMDIPDWLYEKTGGAGVAYDGDYGKGFSPDYSNSTFLAYHQAAVAALGERYGQDTLISYIELGSLGHWGEWHIKTSEGLLPMPDQAEREQYVKHWAYAFPNAMLLMRRPFAEGAAYGVGLYNDMAGRTDSTEAWLEWIEAGGVYDQTGEENALVPMPEAWKTAPIGGELTSSVPMEQLLGADLEQTISLLRRSHTTFLGPKIADEEMRESYDAVLGSLGYRLWISDMTLSTPITGGIQVDLTWQNSGTAPFYFDWPVYLRVADRTGRLLEWVALDLDLRQLLPGETAETSAVVHQIPGWDSLDDFALQLVILDPMTQRPAVRFANDALPQIDGALTLWEVS